MACRQDFASIPAMRPRAVLLSLQNRPLKMEEAKWTEKTLRSLQKSIERQSSAPTKTPARFQHRSLIQTRKRRFGTRNSCDLWLPPGPLYSFGTRKRSCNEIPERNIGLIQATLLRDDVHAIRHCNMRAQDRDNHGEIAEPKPAERLSYDKVYLHIAIYIIYIYRAIYG